MRLALNGAAVRRWARRSLPRSVIARGQPLLVCVGGSGKSVEAKASLPERPRTRCESRYFQPSVIQLLPAKRYPATSSQALSSYFQPSVIQLLPAKRYPATSSQALSSYLQPSVIQLLPAKRYPATSSQALSSYFQPSVCEPPSDSEPEQANSLCSIYLCKAPDPMAGTSLLAAGRSPTAGRSRGQTGCRGRRLTTNKPNKSAGHRC